MVYIKSALVGFVALLIAVLVAALSFLGWEAWIAHNVLQGSGGGGVAVNTPWIPLQLLIVAAVLVFVAGFYWEFRRVRRTAR
jgi:hypothetical protein